jgi:hypothetical protein
MRPSDTLRPVCVTCSVLNQSKACMIDLGKNLNASGRKISYNIIEESYSRDPVKCLLIDCPKQTYLFLTICVMGTINRISILIFAIPEDVSLLRHDRSTSISTRSFFIIGRLGQWAMSKMNINEVQFFSPHTNPQVFPSFSFSRRKYENYEIESRSIIMENKEIFWFKGILPSNLSPFCWLGKPKFATNDSSL